MAEPTTKPGQPHQHGPSCGHIGIRHEGHVDYLSGGHLEHPQGKSISEHVIAVSKLNPDQCRRTSGGHEQGHVHGPDCGHPAIPHGDHLDYLVEGHLHHMHGDHCDDHGPIETV